MKSRVLSMLAIVAVLCCGIADAQVPRRLNYQGFLTSPSGAPINSAALPLLFKLYDASNALVYSETQSVTVSNGVFNVLIGSVTPLTLPFDAQYTLGITVGADTEMSPRQPLAASPYAIRAASAESLAATATVAGSQITGTISTATLPTANLTGTLVTAQITDASVTAAKLASNSCSSGQVLQYNGSAWVCASPAGSSGGTVTSITAGTGLTGGTITGNGTISADTNVLQRRVAATCAVGSSIRAIANDGSVTCQLDAIGAGTITTVATGAGLTGGPITSSGTVSLASTQLLPTLACAADQTVRWNGSSWACASPAASSGGTVTSIIAGTGLTGGTITGNGTISADTTVLQRRVATGCAVGSSIRAIADDGSVTCQLDGIGSGTITSVTTGAGLTGGPITSSGTVSLASTQLLPTLACAADQTVKWNGSSWACATVAVSAAYVAAPQDTVVTAIDSTGLVGAYSSISVAPDGLPVISYYDVTNRDLKVAKCGNPACTAGNIVTPVDTTGNVGEFTSITIGTDGLPIMSYYDATNGDLKVAKCGNAACTVGNTLTAVDTVGNVGQYTSIAIGADGLPIIAYNDATNRDLKVAKCGNAACSAGNTLNAVDTGTNVVSTSIAVALDGLPVISYVDGAGIWVVLKCGDPACSPALLPPRAIFTTVGVNSTIAMAIGSDGLPAISFYGQAGGDLVLAHCVNQYCYDNFSTVTSIGSVDTVGDVGRFTSLAIGADGMPVMSYIDITNGALKVAKCDNVSCSGTPSLRVIGSAGGFSSGQATSIAIGVDGTPVISFQDRTSGAAGALKVAKCSNAFCAPFFRRR